MFDSKRVSVRLRAHCSRRRFLGVAAAAYAAAAAHGKPAYCTETQQSAGHGAAFSVRECYCPAHFGNSYEAMWPREMAAYLTELKWMGYNRYGDWITTSDLCNPYTGDAFVGAMAREHLDRKKKAFHAAQELGLGLNLIVTPNDVYLDQLRSHYAAVKGGKIFGQLVCPSHPEGRSVILGNFRRWFQDLADAGLHFSAFTAFAYDFGGCDCEKCRPWILTFARLMKEVHEIALRRHPNIEPWFCSWAWTPKEHAQFNDWAAKEAPGWLKGMTMEIAYGQTRPKDVAVPAGCRKLAFVHVGYGAQRDMEVYGLIGPVIAPHRLPETLVELRRRGFEGFQAYSEGVCDDCNNALLAGISSGRFKDVDEVLRAYSQRYFNASPEHAADWARWLALWGDRKKVPLPTAEEDFKRLALAAKPTWRLEQWRFKIELETLQRAIGMPKESEWNPDKLLLAERYFATQERLYREVYRVGPVIHVLNPRRARPTWYESWCKATKRSVTRVVSPQQ